MKVQVQLKSTLSGLPLPAAALTRNTANQVVVWVKTAPEQFVALTRQLGQFLAERKDKSPEA